MSQPKVQDTGKQDREVAGAREQRPPRNWASGWRRGDRFGFPSGNGFLSRVWGRTNRWQDRAGRGSPTGKQEDS